MKTVGLLQTQIDCALIHLRTAEAAVKSLSGLTAGTALAQIRLGIDRLEDRWDT